jgi:excinuclease UvrABC nuclease subunit
MPYTLLQTYNFFENIPEHPGVYKIYSLDVEGNPLPLQRVLGADVDGVLYIGKTSNLKNRLRMLWRALNPDYLATGHTFGVNYKQLEIIRHAFPLQTLAVDYEVTTHYGERETELIEQYRQQFGEVPPMNGRK